MRSERNQRNNDNNPRYILLPLLKQRREQSRRVCPSSSVLLHGTAKEGHHGR